MRRDRLLQLEVDHTRLEHGDAVRAVDLQDAVHFRQHHQDTAGQGHRATRQSAPRTARYDGTEVLFRDPDGGGDIFGRCGEDDDLGERALDGGVVLEGDQVLRQVEDGCGTKGVLEVTDEGCVARRVSGRGRRGGCAARRHDATECSIGAGPPSCV